MPDSFTCQVTFTCEAHEAQLLTALAVALDPNADLTSEMALGALPVALGVIRDNLDLATPDGEPLASAYQDARWSPRALAFMERFVSLDSGGV